ncbi:F-box protein SKIP19-like [Triticum urartu]|nr:F-box protein SKIP19-like [Triticum urartu]
MMPSSSSSRRRRRRRGNRNRPPPPPAPITGAGDVTSDEAELPPSAVAHRLECIPFSRAAPPKPNPPEPQPQPHGATHHSSSTSSSRRRRGRRGRKGTVPAPAPAAEEARDWAGLLLDVLCAILHKLDHVEILTGAGQVCRSWRRAARDVPALWRRIDMRGHADIPELYLCGMSQVAVRRSAGQCEAFWGEYAAHEDLILFLGDQAPSLKSLRLISCHRVLIEELVEAMNKFPLLEELELSLCSNIGGNHMFQVSKACPQLRHFRKSELRFYNLQDDSDGEDADSEFRYNKNDGAKGIATMLQLRSLQLFANNLTNEGLTAILNNCVHLESLDIRHCFNIVMDDALRAKCSRIKTLRLPYDLTDDYDIEALSPIWPGLGIGVGSDSDDDCWYGGPDYILDSDEYDDYCDPERYLDGVYIGRRVTLMDLLDSGY